MYARIRGRRRILTPALKSELCRLVAKSATIEDAADTLDVSLRTVQRERKHDEDFDHELRLSLQAEPDPKKLMQTAARTHWRAAAWLLERTDPETYARRPVNTANPKQVEAALCFLLEAALRATPEEQRPAFFEIANAAREQAFDCVFPNFGPWGNPRAPKCPPSPLTDKLIVEKVIAEGLARAIPDRDDEGNILPPPPPPAPPTEEELAAAEARAAERARLRAKFQQQREELLSDRHASDFLEATAQDESPEEGGPGEGDPEQEGILSPKMSAATEFAPPQACHALAPQGASMRTHERRESSPSTPNLLPQERPLARSHAEHGNDEHAQPSDEEQMAAWIEQHRRTPIHQALQRARNATLARKKRAADKRRKLAKRQARRRAG